MSNKGKNLEILTKFGSYLNSLHVDSSQKENILVKYNEMKNILLKDPFEKRLINDFLANYRLKEDNFVNENNNDIFSKPVNYSTEKILTFLMDIEDYCLYNDLDLKEQIDISVPFKRVRGFHNIKKNQSFFQCLAFSHIEFLIKKRNLQKFEFYSKIILFPIDVFDFSLGGNSNLSELNKVLNSYLGKILLFLDNNKNSTEFVFSEFINYVNDPSTKFLDSLVILIKNFVIKLIQDTISLDLYNISLTLAEKNQLLLSINSEEEISYNMKKISSCALNTNLKITCIDMNKKIFTEIIPNSNPYIEFSNNLEMIFFDHPHHKFSIGIRQEYQITSTPKPEKPIIMGQQNFYSLPQFDKKNNKSLAITVNAFETPVENLSFSKTPAKNRNDSFENNNFDFTIPSEKKNIFKTEYEKFDLINQKNKLLHDKVNYYILKFNFHRRKSRGKNLTIEKMLLIC